MKSPKKASAVAIGRGRLGAYEGARAKADSALKRVPATGVKTTEDRKNYKNYQSAETARAKEGSKLVANRKSTKKK